MDMRLNNDMHKNVLKYKRSIDRIIDKYSRLQYQDGGREVDFNNTNIRLIQKYMKRSETVLSSLESQSLTDSRDDSLRAHDITRESQLDITHQDVGTHDTGVSSVSSTQCTVEDYGVARSDVTQLTMSSFDESQKSFSSTEFQPEDHDEELEMSLRSHGKSFVELYPSMINRIGRAWHRQHVTEAADSVVRRYHRWRQQPNRTYLNDTFIVTARHSNPKKITSKTPIKEISSPVKIQVMGTDAIHRSPLRMLVSPQSKQQSPSRVRGEHNPPVLVIDLSDCSETSQPKPISLDETFNMSQLDQSSYIVSPPRPSYPTAKTSLGLAVRHKRFSLGAHSPQTDRSTMYPIHTTAAAERANINCSPLRPSPLKARMASSLSRSPHSFYRSPKAQPDHLFSTEAIRPRSVSTSLSSPPLKRSVPRSMLYEKDSHHSFQSQPSSPLSARAAGHRRLRRHLSFDSSLPFTRNSDSPKELDEDFIKLYHKFVCQNKSPFFRGLPCRYCLRSSEASRGHSSSALAALALSPHRSLLRKRHRELSLSSHPQSKRSRDNYPESSPEFKRLGMEMPRHRLSQSECEHYCFSRSPSKRSMFQGFITQQGSAQESHQDS